MVKMALAIAMIAAASDKTPPPGYTPGKMALDVNVECVSLLGKDLYSTPEAVGIPVEPVKRHLAETDKLVSAQPENPAVYKERGQIYGALWRFRESVQAYSKAIALNPGDADAYVKRGYAFVTLRLFDQAKNDFEHATALAPQSGAAWTGVGITHYLRQKFEDAGRALDLATQFSASGDDKEIAESFRELTRRRLGEPSTPDALRWKSITEYASGVDQLVAGDKSGALETWHEIAGGENWPSLALIAAETEIAAVEGSKKSKPIV